MIATRRVATSAFVTFGLLVLLMFMGGCASTDSAQPSDSRSTQVGPPNVLQFQIMPADSENARPVHALAADAEPANSTDPTGEGHTWRDNTITITVSIDSTNGDAEQRTSQESETGPVDQTPTADVQADVSAPLTP